MSLLRIYAPLQEVPTRCQWALIDHGRETIIGEGRLTELPTRAERVQLVLPAAQVLVTRAKLPEGARRRPGQALAFAVEEKLADEPDENQVSWVGVVGDEDALAVSDKRSLQRWRTALGALGIRSYEVHCETFLLPWQEGEWTLAWNGTDGFVRTGAFEGVATDCGDRQSPPLSLRLMLELAGTRSAGPGSIALFTISEESPPDIQAWTRELGIAVRLAGTWDWRRAPMDAGMTLFREQQRTLAFAGILPRLKPVAWIASVALIMHAVALVAHWSVLASEQRALRQQMESRFRSTFPEAVAVVDPVLQMRRKLAEARSTAGVSDNGDFLPMVESVAVAMKSAPAGALRLLTYEGGRLTLELAAIDEGNVSRIVAQLKQSGLGVERSALAQRSGTFISVRAP